MLFQAEGLQTLRSHEDRTPEVVKAAAYSRRQIAVGLTIDDTGDNAETSRQAHDRRVKFGVVDPFAVNDHKNTVCSHASDHNAACDAHVGTQAVKVAAHEVHVPERTLDVAFCQLVVLVLSRQAQCLVLKFAEFLELGTGLD